MLIPNARQHALIWSKTLRALEGNFNEQLLWAAVRRNVERYQLAPNSYPENPVYTGTPDDKTFPEISGNN